VLGAAGMAQGPSEVLERFLYVGSQYSANNPSLLSSLGIRYILNLKGGAYATFPGFNKKIVVIDDYGTQELEAVLPECLAFIDEAKAASSAVVLHCQGGVNRSPTIALAYLMLRCDMSLKAAWDLLKAARPMASPHENYWAQLRALELKTRGVVSLSKEDVWPTLQDQMRAWRDQALLEQQQEKEAKEAKETTLHGDARST